MSILSTIFRGEKYLKGTDGYQKMSEWQLAKDVEYENGKNGEEVISDIKEQLTAGDTPFRFGVNDSGEYGYIITDSEGADTVVPFKRGYKVYRQVVNSIDAKFLQPKNSSGNTSNSVGVLGRGTWTNAWNSTYNDVYIELPLNDFKDFDYIFGDIDKVNEKIKSFQVRIYGCFYQDGRVQEQLRIPKSSAYCYIDYFTLCDFSTGTTNNMNWKNYETDVNGYYGKPTIFGTAESDYAADDKRLDTNGAWRIYLNKNGIQFDSFNGSKIQKFQFKHYLGYELTIVYE